MIEVTILIPVADNDGITFISAHHEAFEVFILDRFGGYTRLPGSAMGGWKDSKTGITYRDATLQYMVAVEGLIGNDALREAISFAKAHYRQLAILVRYLGVTEII